MVTRFRRRRRRGISLVEIVAALAVLAAVGGAGAWIGTAQFHGIARSHETNAAVRAAESRLDLLRAPGAKLAEGSRAFDVPETPALQGVEASETFERAAPGLLRATIRVTWDAADGGRGSVRLATLIAEEAER